MNSLAGRRAAMFVVRGSGGFYFSSRNFTVLQEDEYLV